MRWRHSRDPDDQTDQSTEESGYRTVQEVQSWTIGINTAINPGSGEGTFVTLDKHGKRSQRAKSSVRFGMSWISRNVKRSSNVDSTAL